MSKYNATVKLVLPGHLLIEEFQPNENLLQLLGTTTKELIEMFLQAWAGENGLEPYPSFGLINDTREHQARLLVMDILFEALERRIESGESLNLTREDRRAAEQTMMAIWHGMNGQVFGLLEDLGMDEGQLAGARFVGWLANDFIIEVPRRPRALANLAGFFHNFHKHREATNDE